MRMSGQFRLCLIRLARCDVTAFVCVESGHKKPLDFRRTDAKITHRFLMSIFRGTRCFRLSLFSNLLHTHPSTAPPAARANATFAHRTTPRLASLRSANAAASRSAHPAFLHRQRAHQDVIPQKRTYSQGKTRTSHNILRAERVLRFRPASCESMPWRMQRQTCSPTGTATGSRLATLWLIMISPHSLRVTRPSSRSA